MSKSVLTNFKDKVAVVTGAGSGIGLSLAKLLARAGAKVVLSDIRQTRVEQAAQELIQAEQLDASNILAVKCDVTSVDDILNLRDQTLTTFGCVDLLLNNAGCAQPAKSIAKTDDDLLRWVMETNFFGSWNVCQTFLRVMLDQKTPAHIVNTGSENSFSSLLPALGAYSASKHALLGYTGILRLEAPDFLGVSVLCPGLVNTNLSDTTETRQDKFGGPIPQRTGNSFGGPHPDMTAQHTLDSIVRGDFIIVPEYASRVLAKERCDEIMSAFDEQTKPYEGWEENDVRTLVSRLQ